MYYMFIFFCLNLNLKIYLAGKNIYICIYFFFVCLINFNYKYIKILSNLFFILLKYLTLVYDNINRFIIYNKCFDSS